MPQRPTGGGPLFQKVAFDQLDKVADGYGNFENAFVEQFTIRANFTWMRIFLGQAETVQAGRYEGQQPAIVRVRVSNDTKRIQHDWRMRDIRLNIPYAIKAITMSDDRAYFDILVARGQPA